jgi:glycosyltransferase involved in cell wall biosynthesis
MPDVTVVIPTRNRTRLLTRALQSVLNQEEADFEVIVVDDASTDATPRTVEGFQDDRISVIRLDRRVGVAAARNVAIAEARGRWLAFLDDDDVWAVQKLRRQQAVASDTGASLVYAGVVLLDDEGSPIEVVRWVEPEELMPGILETNLVGTPSAVFAETGLVRDVGAFDDRLEALADWDLWIRLVAAGSAALCRDYLCGYTMHREGMHLHSPTAMRAEITYMRRKHRDLGRAHGVTPAGPSFQLWLAGRYRRAGLTSAAARTYFSAGIAGRRPRHALRGLALLGGERTARLGRRVAPAEREPAPRPELPNGIDDVLAAATAW